MILGPVGVGKAHLATALGHIAVRRRVQVQMTRADKLFKRLKAARLVSCHELVNEGDSYRRRQRPTR